MATMLPRRRRGATAIEYGLIAGLIISVALGLLTLTGVNLNNLFDGIGNNLQNSVGTSKPSYNYTGGAWTFFQTIGSGFPIQGGSTEYTNASGSTIYEYSSGYFGYPQQVLIYSASASAPSVVPVGNKTLVIPPGGKIIYDETGANSIAFEGTFSSSAVQTDCTQLGGSYTNGNCSNLPSSLNYSVKSAATALQAPNASLFTD